MALKATIFKVALQVSDMDRQLYNNFPLTIARHPSETDERMMARLVAFAFHADEALTFTKGLSSSDEPDLWKKHLHGDIQSWIEVGLPSEDRLRKACNRSAEVWVYAYGTDSNMNLWWSKIEDKLARFENLKVLSLPEDVTKQFPDFVNSAMALQCSIDDGALWLSDASNNIQIEPLLLNGSA